MTRSGTRSDGGGIHSKISELAELSAERYRGRQGRVGGDNGRIRDGRVGRTGRAVDGNLGETGTRGRGRDARDGEHHLRGPLVRDADTKTRSGVGKGTELVDIAAVELQGTGSDFCAMEGKSVIVIDQVAG